MDKEYFSNLFKEYIGTISESIEGYKDKHYYYTDATGYKVITNISTFLNDYYKKDNLTSNFKFDVYGHFGPNLSLKFGHFDGRKSKKDGIYIYIEFPKKIKQTEYIVSLELGSDERYSNNKDIYNENVLSLQKLMNLDSDNDKFSKYINNRKENKSILCYKTDNYDIIPELIEHIKNEYYFPILNKIKLKDDYWNSDAWENFQKEIFGEYYMPIEKNNPKPSSSENKEDENIYKKSQIQKTEDIKTGFNRLYYGVPGCGKSHYIEHHLNDIVGIKDDDIIKIRTVFHPDYSNSDFVGQVMPINENNDLKYKPIPGPFTKALKKALDNKTKKIVLIIEEINRGNASAIFGDIFQLLDRNEEKKESKEVKFSIDNNFINQYSELKGNGNLKNFINENKGITLPDNLYIIGTMNTSDQNVYTLDTAFKRRWEMKYYSNTFSEMDEIRDMIVPNSNGVRWETFVQKINKAITDKGNQILQGEDKQLGKYFIDEKCLIEKNDELQSMEDDDRISYCNDRNKFEKFRDKVLVYLFDDVTKYNHGSLFLDNINCIDDLMNKNKLEEIIKVSFNDD